MMTECPTCHIPVRGHYDVDGIVTLIDYEPPAHCHNCGAAFPWTERRIAGAVELLKEDGDLSPEELQQVRSDLKVLSRDTPSTLAASSRFRKVMTKVGTSVASGVREIVIDVLSETAKMAIWGK